MYNQWIGSKSTIHVYLPQGFLLPSRKNTLKPRINRSWLPLAPTICWRSRLVHSRLGNPDLANARSVHRAGLGGWSSCWEMGLGTFSWMGLGSWWGSFGETPEVRYFFKANHWIYEISIVWWSWEFFCSCLQTKPPTCKGLKKKIHLYSRGMCSIFVLCIFLPNVIYTVNSKPFCEPLTPP